MQWFKCRFFGGPMNGHFCEYGFSYDWLDANYGCLAFTVHEPHSLDEKNPREVTYKIDKSATPPPGELHFRYVEPSANPATEIKRMLKERYGQEHLDFESLKDFEQYCDELVESPLKWSFPNSKTATKARNLGLTIEGEGWESLKEFHLNQWAPPKEEQ